MKNIIEDWRGFTNEGLAQMHRFDTAADVITDEALNALKRGILMSIPGSNFVEFSFIGGKSQYGRNLPREIQDLIKKVDGRVTFSNKFEDPNDSSAVGSYQESKKYLRLFVTVPSTFAVQDIRPSNLVAKIKSTLRHELEHTLDNLKGLKKKAQVTRFDYLEDYENYFTSPHEVNAYTVGFHKRHKLTGQSWSEVKNNFLKWLENSMFDKVNAEKSWDKLKKGQNDRSYASAKEVENLIKEIDSLLISRYEERYRADKASITIYMS